MASVMLRLEKKGVSTVFRSPACYLVFFVHRSLQQRQLPKKYIQLWDSCYQMQSSKLVLNRDCVVQKSEVAKL